jgi:signal transduction histidine kinase
MKIRKRLAIIYALAAFTTLAAGGVFIYWFSARFHQQEFFRRLEERVDVSEQILLEKNESVTQAVREKFLHTLDEEQEYAITLQTSGLDSLDRLFFVGLGDQVLQNGTCFFWQKGRQGVCKRYHLPAGEYAVVVTAVDVFGKSKLEYLRKILLAGAILGSVLLSLVGYWVTGRALRPLENKIHEASRIGANRLDLRLAVENPDDELGELTLAFNSMLDRLQSAFEAQRRFVSNASHELRNPMTAIIGEAEVLLARERTPAEYRAAVQIIQTEAERLERLTNDLLSLATSDSMTQLSAPQPVALDGLLLEVLEKFPAERLMLDISTADTTPMVMASQNLLTSAINNVLDNAFKFSGSAPVTVSLATSPTGCLIRISDLGIGIPADEMAHIYQPLFRAANARGFRGTGFGLPLAKKIIELHGGQLEVHSEEGKGTTASIFLQIVPLV